MATASAPSASTTFSSPSVVLASQSSSLYKTFSSYGELRKERVKEELQHQLKQKNVTVFGLTWTSNSNGNFLLGCTSSGDLVVWEVATPNSGGSEMISLSRPMFRVNISSGKLYSIKLEEVGGKHLIFASGDEGVQVFEWGDDILEMIRNSLKGELAKLSPIRSFKPHPSPLEDKGIEVNEVQVLKSNGKDYLFGAAGDSFGCYKWNLETGQLITTYASSGRGYLSSIQLVPPSDDNSSTLLLLGGEDGTLTIWDVDQEKRIDCIDLNNVSAADITTMANAPRSSATAAPLRKRSKHLPSRRITSICVSDRNWWTIAGGSIGGGAGGGVRGGGSNSKSGPGSCGDGFLATFYAQTRQLVAWADTRETPQQLAYLPSCIEHPSMSRHNLLSVANEGVVSHWNTLSLERTRRLWCTPPSAYAAAISTDGKYAAIGGVGCFVDVFDQSGGMIMRLTL